MNTTSTVYLERRGSTVELILNRPEVLNAENWAIADDFHAALDEIEASPDVRAVVVSGKGRAFSSGIDLTQLAAGEIKTGWFERFDEGMRRLEQLDALTIAKIHGYALGGGLQLTLVCDLRIAAEGTRFGLPAVLEALIPGMGTYRLARFIGLGRARRLALTGEMIRADEALRIGLVDWVVPEDRLDEKVESVIATTAKGSAVARGYTKKLITSSFETEYEEQFTKYLEYQSECLRSPEHKAAMAEYRNRRK
jgi:enoyl-CoA hydratase